MSRKVVIAIAILSLLVVVAIPQKVVVAQTETKLEYTNPAGVLDWEAHHDQYPDLKPCALMLDVSGIDSITVKFKLTSPDGDPYVRYFILWKDGTRIAKPYVVSGDTITKTIDVSGATSVVLHFQVTSSGGWDWKITVTITPAVKILAFAPCQTKDGVKGTVSVISAPEGSATEPSDPWAPNEEPPIQPPSPPPTPPPGPSPQPEIPTWAIVFFVIAVIVIAVVFLYYNKIAKKLGKKKKKKKRTYGTRMIEYEF